MVIKEIPDCPHTAGLLVKFNRNCSLLYISLCTYVFNNGVVCIPRRLHVYPSQLLCLKGPSI